MAKTIVEIQAAIDAQNLDARQLINLIVDYLQANPPGGGAIPTLAQVLEAGNSAGSFDIDMNSKNILSAGNVDSLEYSVNGVTGKDYDDAVTNITISKGIVLNAS